MVRTRAITSATTTDPMVNAIAPNAPPPSQTHSSANNVHGVPSSTLYHNQTQNDQPAYKDIRSPYYLSSADHPELALATGSQ
uniref:Uncharacterized protein n=1 Tax=Cannabis sativa TaxID=3483 RepID=A0A803P8A3_CANSA